MLSVSSKKPAKESCFGAVSVKNSTTHVVLPNQLTVYLRERSAVWQCAYAVDGVWQSMSTGKRDLDEAKKQAHEILVEAKYRKKINQAPITRQFKDIAKHVVKRMTDELAAGGGRPIFKGRSNAHQQKHRGNPTDRPG